MPYSTLCQETRYLDVAEWKEGERRGKKSWQNDMIVSKLWKASNFALRAAWISLWGWIPKPVLGREVFRRASLLSLVLPKARALLYPSSFRTGNLSEGCFWCELSNVTCWKRCWGNFQSSPRSTGIVASTCKLGIPCGPRRVSWWSLYVSSTFLWFFLGSLKSVLCWQCPNVLWQICSSERLEWLVPKPVLKWIAAFHLHEMVACVKAVRSCCDNQMCSCGVSVSGEADLVLQTLCRSSPCVCKGQGGSFAIGYKTIGFSTLPLWVIVLILQSDIFIVFSRRRDWSVKAESTSWFPEVTTEVTACSSNTAGGVPCNFPFHWGGQKPLGRKLWNPK